MLEVTVDMLEAFARGAAFVGSGGGSNPYIGRLMVTRALQEGKRVRLIDLDELTDDALIVVFNGLGAPSIMVEKLPSVDEVLAAVYKIQEVVGKKVDAIIPIESGGLNSMTPMYVSAELDIPLVDADGMARAFPELQMTTYNIYAKPRCLAVVANHLSETVVIDAKDPAELEREARALATSMGGHIFMASQPMDVKTLRAGAIPKSLSLAYQVGLELEKTIEDESASLDTFCASFSDTIYEFAKVIFQGKIIDQHQQVQGAFNFGEVSIQGVGEFSGTLQIAFQNENLIVKKDGELIAIIPDLICIVTSDTLQPLTCEALRYGQRVTVFAVRAPKELRTPEALKILGPQGFGIDEVYEPIK